MLLRPKQIPIDRIRELYSFDPETGVIRNKRTGLSVGSQPTRRYSVLTLDQTDQYLSHRIAWAMHYGRQPLEIDHINGDRNDNRICNLREVDRQQNQRNRGSKASSTYKGVSRITTKAHSARQKPWRARITIDGKEKIIGCFETAEEAGLAYQIAAEKYFGTFATVRRL